MFLIHRCSLLTSFSLFGIFSSTEADESFVRTFSSSGFSTTGPSSSLDSRFLLLSQVLRGFHSSLSFDDHTPCASPERASSKLLLSIAAHAPLTHSTRAFGMQRLFGRPESTFFLWRIFDTNGVPAARTCAFSLFGAAGISQHDRSLLIIAPRASPWLNASSSFAAAHVSRVSFSLSCWRTEASEHQCPFSGFPTRRTFSTACLITA